MMRRTLPLDRLPSLETAARGLGAHEASARRARFGANDVVEARRGAWWALLADTARDPMIWFLCATGAVYAFLGDRAEAVALLAAIVPLAAMDAILHRRTHASLEGLRSRLADHAVVRRDGALVTIASLEVVPGDVALVEAGESFPADGVLLEATDVQVDESSLTGESYPVRKRPLETPGALRGRPAVTVDHWGVAGTRVLTGRATVLVVFTGGETLYGSIARSAAATASERTPLQQAVARLVATLIGAAAVACAVLAATRIVQGRGWLDALLAAVTLGVAAVPEEFPVVFAFYLGIGVYRLARRHALVRRAVSVENIGRVTAICSDKTGTITSGELVLMHRVSAPPIGDAELMLAARLAARPETGDPLDRAIAALPDAAAIDVGAWHEVARFPFTEDRKRETAIVRPPGLAGRMTTPPDAGDATSPVAVTKGAPEVVLALCVLPEREKETWQTRAAELAASGHKVIACAVRSLGTEPAAAEPDDGYTFAGLLAFEDPVREDVAEAVRACADAGIRPIMLTGDHPATARAVALEIGLGGADPTVLVGDELASMLTRDPRAALAADVVARAAPAHKVALVRALQEAGEVVAVTGDGVNDVPALKRADVGIAMGERGTRSAREVAAIVLLDDNFRTIVAAIAEGRQLFRNLRLSFAYLIVVHVPLVATAALIPLAGFPLLYLPIHIVWLELVIHPTALLAFQEPSRTLAAYASAERGRRARFFTARQWFALGSTGALTAVLVTLEYLRNVSAHADVARGRSSALLVLLAASAGVTAVLSRGRTWASRVIVAAVVASSVALVQLPTTARLLKAVPVHLHDLVVALAVGLAVAPIPLLALRPFAPTRLAGERADGLRGRPRG